MPATKGIVRTPLAVSNFSTIPEIAPQISVWTVHSVKRNAFRTGSSLSKVPGQRFATRPPWTSKRIACRETSKTGAIRPSRIDTATIMGYSLSNPVEHYANGVPEPAVRERS